MLRKWILLACLGSLGTGWAASGQELPGQKKLIAEAQSFPVPAQVAAPAPNPQLERAIAKALFESGKLARYQINVIAYGGVVDLRGEVADESQRAIAVTIARSAPGVQMVRDWLMVRSETALMQAQAKKDGPAVLQPLPMPLPMPMPMPLPAPQPVEKEKGPLPGERIDGGIPGPLPEPTPIFQAPPGPNPSLQPPPLPPYAWPTYAPYNNYSRVAYPLTYPYEQWPFIGPMYPFPRIPLGWRSVSLTWQDGCWWYHRNPTGHDWWRIRYH